MSARELALPTLRPRRTTQSVELDLPEGWEPGEGKVAIVTGASSGIGRASAIALAQAGFEVWAGARRVARMSELNSHGIRTLPLDVTDEDSRTAFVETVLAGSGRIDVLVNNAGIGSFGSVEDTPMQAGRELFEVNLFGAVRLVQLVLPTMRAQKSGRLVNISSVAGHTYEPFGAWYHASKHALEGFSDSLRLEVKPFGIEVSIVQPGLVNTDWRRTARKDLLRLSRGGAYEKAAKRLSKVLAVADKRGVGSNPSVVAQAVLAACVAPKPRTRYAVGAGARAALTARAVLPDAAVDRVLSAVGPR